MDRVLADLLACPLTGRALDPWVARGDDGRMEYGVLRSDVAEYPVVEGIPVMFGNFEDVVALVRAERYDDALTRMILHDIPRGGAGRALEAFASIRSTRAIASRLLRLDDERRRRDARRALDDTIPGALVRFEYLDSAGRGVDAYDYFSLRAATPRYLVALSCIDAVPDGTDAVLDVGCGAGLVTWALRQRMGARPVIGVDSSFVMAFTASRDTSDGGRFVCGDATALPFADGAFGAALATDVLTFIDRRRTAVAELDRVLGPRGWCAVASLHNAGAAHPYTYRPVSMAAWRRLFAHAPHRVVSDDDVLDRYRQGLGLPAGRGNEADEGNKASRLTVVMARDERALVDHGPFADWPHARGCLQMNPLYEQTGRTYDGVAYRRRLPSAVFREDNEPMDEYLPEEVVVSDAAVHALRDGDRTPEVNELLASLVVIGGPGEPWLRR